MASISASTSVNTDDMMETSVISRLVGLVELRRVDRLPDRQADEVQRHDRHREQRQRVLALEAVRPR